LDAHQQNDLLDQQQVQCGSDAQSDIVHSEDEQMADSNVAQDQNPEQQKQESEEKPQNKEADQEMEAPPAQE